MLPILALDPFALGTPWAGAFAGLAGKPVEVRTVTALREAVARGGYVRLEAGTYDLSGSTLNVPARTVIEGAGMGRTVLLVRRTDGGDHAIRLLGTEIGLRAMTVRNEGGEVGVLRGNWGGGHDDARTFLDGVAFEIGKGQPVWLLGSPDVLIRGCRFVSTSDRQPPLHLDGMTRCDFERNLVEWRTGRVALTMWSDSRIVGNAFRLDGGHRGPGRPETGGVELSYANDVEFAGNRVVQYGPYGTGDNDGEMVMTQASNLPEWQGAGSVLAARGTTLETDLDWGGDPWIAPNSYPTQRRAVYLLTGPGAGQWRWATPAGQGRIEVDRPWKTPPERGDRMSAGSVTAHRLRIRDNTILHGVRGIEIYAGALECEVSGNTVRDSGGIVLRSSSERSGRTPRSGLEHWPLWNCRAMGNRVSNADGWRAAALSVLDVDVSATGLPLAIRNVVVSGNIIVGKGQRFSADNVGDFDGIEGKSVAMVANVPPAVGRQEGVVFRDNRLAGAVERIERSATRG